MAEHPMDVDEDSQRDPDQIEETEDDQIEEDPQDDDDHDEEEAPDAVTVEEEELRADAKGLDARDEDERMHGD